MNEVGMEWHGMILGNLKVSNSPKAGGTFPRHRRLTGIDIEDDGFFARQGTKRMTGMTRIFKIGMVVPSMAVLNCCIVL